MIELWSVPFSASDSIQPNGWTSLSDFLAFAGGSKQTLGGFARVQLPKLQKVLIVKASDLVITPNLVVSGENAYWCEGTQVGIDSIQLSLTYDALLSHATNAWKVSGLWTKLSSLSAPKDFVAGFVPLSVDFANPMPKVVSDGRVPAYKVKVLVMDAKVGQSSFKFSARDGGYTTGIGSNQSDADIKKALTYFTRPYVTLIVPFKDRGIWSGIIEANSSAFKQAFTAYVPDDLGVYLRSSSADSLSRGAFGVLSVLNSTDVNDIEFPFVADDDGTNGVKLLTDGSMSIQYGLGNYTPTPSTYYPRRYSEFYAPFLFTPILVDSSSLSNGATGLAVYETFGAKHYWSLRTVTAGQTTEVGDWRWKSKVIYDKTLDIDVSSVGAYANYMNTNPYSSTTGRYLGYIGQAWQSVGAPMSAMLTGGNPLSALNGALGFGVSLANSLGKIDDINHHPSQITGSNEVQTAIGLSDDEGKMGFISFEASGQDAVTYDYLLAKYGQGVHLRCELGTSVPMPPAGVMASTDYQGGYRFVQGTDVIVKGDDLPDGSDLEAIRKAMANGVEQYHPATGGKFRPYSA